MSIWEYSLVALAVLGVSVLAFGFFQITRARSYVNAQSHLGGYRERQDLAPPDKYGFAHMGHCLPWW